MSSMKRAVARRLAIEPLEGRALLAATSLPTVSIADATVLEGADGTANLVFTVALSAAAKRQAVVPFRTVDGTATVADSDYVATSGSVTFRVGQRSATVTVPVRGDLRIEADETLQVVLGTPSNAVLGRTTATGAIRNDDQLPAEPPAPPATGSWTVLVYMTGEDLNTYAAQDINEMEQALATLPGSVRIVVSWDQPRAGVGRAYATGSGAQPAWRGYGRSVLTADADINRISSAFDVSFGERNTGDPATLVDFVTWGVQRAPAENYLLQLWGHGDGLAGSQFDSESRGDALTIAELGGALMSPLMPAIGLVSFDNCLMAMAEVAAAIPPSVGGVFVASQELVSGAGQNYVTAYSALAVTDPAAVTAAQVAAGMVASYGVQYRNDRSRMDTFSAVSTAGQAALQAALRQFVDATATLNATHRTTLRTAARASITYDTPSSRDLGSFMGRVAAATSLPATVRSAAAGVTAALSAAVVAKTADQRGSSGVAIYLPLTSDGYLASYARDAQAFTRATGWDQFARWLATGSRSAAGTSSVGGRGAARGGARWA
jgi:hypothetical protein